MNEATATWFESQVSSNKNYISTEAVANSLFLYTNGLLTPTGATQQDIQNHGYGASILVKWLTSKYGNEYVYNLYKKRNDLPNTSLIDILKSLSSVTLENDWMLFCQDYIAGKVYPNSVLDISLRGSAPSKKYIWEYDGIKDKYSYWKALELNGSLPHLSARTYRINCNETFEPSAMLEIAFVNYDGIDNKCKTYLYKYSSGNLSYIAEAKIVGKEAGYPGSYVYSVLLTKVETKIKKGDSLILLVSNANNGNSPATTVPNANKISTFGLIRLKPDKIKAMVADVYGQIHKSPDYTDIPKLLSLGGSFTLGHNPDPWEFDIAWTGDTTFDIDIDYTTPFKTSYRIKGEFSSDFSSLVSIDYSHYNDFGVSPMRKETDWQFVCNNVGRYYQYINDVS